MKNKVIGSIAGFSLIGTSLLFAQPAQAYMCLNLNTYEYIEVADVVACAELHRNGYKSTPVSTPTPTPTVAPSEPVVDEEDLGDETISSVADVEALLEDDAYGQEVLVETPTGDRLSGEVTSEEKFDLQDAGITVEAVQPVSINYSWGIDRINQPSLPLDNYYDGTGKGSGVEVYIIDTGVDYNHSNYNDIRSSGFDYVGGDRWRDGGWKIIDGNPDDCHGHGTHVAGTVASKDYGVAPEATIIGVRVLSCSGSGSTAGVTEGVDWVTYQKSLKPSTPMVINMSLGGGYSTILNNAVKDAVDAGIIVVVAAGNSNGDASYASPASEPTAITVGSTDRYDRRSNFSNYGSIVDIYAPGTSIVSTRNNGGSTTMSGTSMASPHVAGIAAGYLADGNSASGFDSWMKDNATTFTQDRSGTTDKLVQFNVGTDPDPEPTPEPTPTPTPTPTPEPDPAPAPAPPAAPAPPPSGGGGGGSAPAPAPAPEPIVEVPPVYVPPTVENPVTIQQQPDNETVTEQPRSNPIKKVGKKTVVTLEFDSSDYTSIRTYKWQSKKKRWKEVRYTAQFDDGIQMSFKKNGKYRVIGVNVLTDTRDILVTFKIKKVKKK